jgi:hypothetical protein
MSDDITRLGHDQMRGARFGSIASLRSGGSGGLPFQAKGPYLRITSGSMGW